jgi:hypothetical protein
MNENISQSHAILMHMMILDTYTRKNAQVDAMLMKTVLNNVLLPTLFIAVTILNNIVTPDSGSTTLFNIVDKCDQRGQQNIVQSCRATGSALFAV